MGQNYENNSDRPNTKRRLATLEGTKFDLNIELPKMFKAFDEAHKLYANEIIQTPPQSRNRGFEASLFSSKMIQSIQKYFPDNWKFGKYKRFNLRTNDYIILFKKLDKSGKPMNIKTKAVDAISGQLSLPLFNEDTYVEEPILFFGYQKDKVGNIHDPKLVYIDEGNTKWVISSSDIDTGKTIQIEKEVQTATPVLRKGKKEERKQG